MPQSIVQPLRRWDPEQIGPYSIIGKLGAGAMGQVFLARSAAGRLVAVKTIRVELAEEAGFRARFAREVAAASRVSGVFTAAVIEANPDADLPWVATAYVPAPSLSTLVKQAGPLPVAAVRWLAAGCAEALQSIHAAGLLHRDVKPSNVLVAPDGPRVIDFGIARAAERVQLTATHGASGTPAYMAPEQARDATQASPASDVFSLGATLVYAATGHAPYEGETVMDILVRLATEPPDLAGVPEELMDLVAPCLERVPRDAAHGRHDPGQAGPVRQPGRPRPFLPARGRDGGDRRVPAGTAGPGRGRRRPGGGDRQRDGRLGGRGGEPVPHVGLADPAAGLSLDQRPRSAARAVDQASRRRRRAPDAEPSPRPAARVLLPMWARVAAAVVLLGGGIGIGAALHGPGARAAGDTPAGTSSSSRSPSAAAIASTVSGSHSARAVSTSTASSTARVTDPGPVASPPPCARHPVDTTPELCVSQPFGDGDTVYIIHGTGFRQFTTVTVQLVGVGVAPYQPVTSTDQPTTDIQGTFSYAVDQGHVFFTGPIPPGSYKVTASESGGLSASASFEVNAAAQGGPPVAPGQGPP